MLVVPVMLALPACGDGFRFGAPKPVSEGGEDVLDLWRGFHWIALGVGLLIWGLVLFAVLRYRRRNDDLPSQSPYNIPIEIVYTVAPLLVVIGLFAFTVLAQEKVTALAADPDVVVDVTGFRWSWEFFYPEEGVRVVSDGVNPPEMTLPVGATVRFRLSSPDVMHSFWVPRFLVKRDLIPGIDNELDVEVMEAGRWEGRCAEFCGLEHYRMNFSVTAVPPDYYQAWLDRQRSSQEQRR